METLQHILPLLVSVSLASLVLAVGLNATLDDVLYLFRRPHLLLRAFVAISVVVPLAAILAVAVLPVQPISKAGILMMAIAPVPPLAPGKQLKMGGGKSYVYGLYVAFAVLAAVIVPASVFAMGLIYGKSVIIPMGPLLRLAIVSVLLPLGLGMGIGMAFPRQAPLLSSAVSKVSMLLLLAVCIPLLVKAWPQMQALIGDGTVLAIVLIVAAGLAGGHFLGGPEHADRVALAAAASTRHPGIALMIASANGRSKQLIAVILLFLLLGILAGLPYQLWVKPRGAPRRSWPVPSPKLARRPRTLRRRWGVQTTRA